MCRASRRSPLSGPGKDAPLPAFRGDYRPFTTTGGEEVLSKPLQERTLTNRQFFRENPARPRTGSNSLLIMWADHARRVPQAKLRPGHNQCISRQTIRPRDRTRGQLYSAPSSSPRRGGERRGESPHTCVASGRLARRRAAISRRVRTPV